MKKNYDSDKKPETEPFVTNGNTSFLVNLQSSITEMFKAYTNTANLIFKGEFHTENKPIKFT